MSGKSSRRLRRLAEQAMNSGKGSTTIQANDTQSYKEHKVPSSRNPAKHRDSPVSTTIRSDRKCPRALYQEMKKAQKDGSAKKEANRIKQEYRQEQRRAAKRVADKIASIVEQPKQLIGLTVNPKDWLEKFANWLIDNDQVIAKYLPFSVNTAESRLDLGLYMVRFVSQEEQLGIEFVIDAIKGELRCIDGELHPMMIEDTGEENFRMIADALTMDVQAFDQLGKMGVLNAQ